ncbi:MAG: hypothetical protein ABJH45_01035 [Paracoccaceae bacterium]
MLTRVVIVVFCAAILAAGLYLSSKGVWGASSGVVSVRGGSYASGGSRVK